MKSRRDIFTGIELGSDKVRVLVATFKEPASESGEVVVRGYSEVPSLKVLKDEPVSPNIVSDQLLKAMQNAWNEAGIDGYPGFPVLVLSGAYVTPEILPASIELDERMPVAEEDFEEVMRSISRMGEEQIAAGGESKSVLPCINRCFRLSNGRVVFNPVGQYTKKLTAESFFFDLDHVRLMQVDSAVGDAMPPGTEIAPVYAPVALGCGICPPTVSDEPQGLLIDLGAGMTSFLIPTRQGSVVCDQVAVGMDHLANDLSIALGFQIETSRKIVSKLTELRCTVEATPDGAARRVEIREDSRDSAPKLVNASTIEAILDARLTELFQVVKARVEACDALKWIGNEIKLTGVGANLPRVCAVAEKVFTKRRVQVGTPYGVASDSRFRVGPEHTLLIGSIRYAFKEKKLAESLNAGTSGVIGMLKNIITQMRG